MKTNKEEVTCEAGNWIDLAQDMAQLRTYLRRIMNQRIQLINQKKNRQLALVTEHGLESGRL